MPAKFRFRRWSAALLFGLLPSVAHAGGPLEVAGTVFGGALDGRPFVWDAGKPVQYRTPSAGALGNMSNAQATARVARLFQVWQDVPTASITYQNSGSIRPTGAYSGGAVDTAQKFDAIESSCNSGTQSPIVFDANGGLFRALGLDSAVIGFAGPCALDSAGHIVAAEAALNGAWIDGNLTNGELTSNQFDEAFVHEFGHFSGLDHAQINVEVLQQPTDQCDPALLAGLPVMFPFAHCQSRAEAGLPILSSDDAAWISRLYPETANDAAGHVPFASAYGTISGTIFFADGQSAAQGVNVIARSESDPKKVAVSVVSGYLFTGDPGQAVTGSAFTQKNRGDGGLGSHDPLRIGTFDIPVPAGSYTIEIESINEFFAGGSSVGPLSPPIPLAGDHASFGPFQVTAGGQLTGIDFSMNGNFARFDQFEPQ